MGATNTGFFVILHIARQLSSNSDPELPVLRALYGESLPDASPLPTHKYAYAAFVNHSEEPDLPSEDWGGV